MAKLFAFVGVTLAILGLQCHMKTWVIINENSIPVRWEVNGGGGVLRPHSRSEVDMFFPPHPREGPERYVVTAYEFVPGKGRLLGWFEEDGQAVVGGKGALVFCETYSWQQIKDTKRTLVIRSDFVNRRSVNEPQCPDPDVLGNH
jgi:hypothetical protein